MNVRTLALAICFFLVSKVATAADLPNTPLHLTTHQLANGLLVAVVENSAVPLVTIEIGVHNGAMNEPLALNGLSHLYEHMFFKGNAAIPSQEAYLERLRQLGAVWNGSTGNERVNYFFTMDSDKLDAGMEFMSHAIITPLFNPQELVKERQVVLGEFDRNEADPGYHLDHAVDQALWYKYPTYKDALGTRSSIIKASVEQMRWMQKTYYIPNNSILVVSGDVQAARVFALADKYFANWKAGPNPFVKYPLVVHPPLPASQAVVVAQPVSDVNISLNWEGPDTWHDLKGAVVADVFSYAVDQVGSRLQKALVDSGLATSARLGYDTQHDVGQISLSIEAPPDKALQALRTALDETRHFADADYVTADQWQSAQTQLAVNDLYEREKVSELAHMLTFWWSVGGLDDYLQYIPRVRVSTTADAAAYARRYISGKPMVAGVMSSPEDATKYGITQNAVQQILAAVSLQTESRVRHASLVPLSQRESLPDVQHFQVDGIDVLLRTNTASAVVAASLYLRGGSANLTAANQGIEQLAAVTAERGGTRSASRVERSRRLNGMGTALGLSAQSDYTRLDLKCVHEFFDPSWEIFTQSLSEPAFASADVELFRRRTVSQLHGEHEEADAEVRRTAEEFFFRGHPYALRPSGTEAVVSQLTASQLAEYFRNLAVKSRMLLVVVGNIDRAHLETAIHGTLGKLPAGNWSPAAISPVPERRSEVSIESRQLPTTYVRGMFPAPSARDADYAAASLMAKILSDRLFQEVRTKRNLSYAVFSAISERQANYGMLYVTSTDPTAAVRVIMDEVRKLVTTPVPLQELKDVASGYITHYFLSMETSGAQAEQWGQAQIEAGDWRQAYLFTDQVRQVTPQQVQAAAAKFIRGVQWSVLGDGSKIDRKVFESN